MSDFKAKMHQIWRGGSRGVIGNGGEGREKEEKTGRGGKGEGKRT